MKAIAIGILFFAVSASFAQPGSEIYLFDLKSKKGEITISNPVNITHHNGYDNQPSFDAENSLVYYSSFNDDGRSDIKTYDYKKKETKSFTATAEREYSPTLTPDKQFVSCTIQRDNNAQDLGKYPVGGGTPDVIINNLIVGYHAWMDNSHLVLFVLGDPNSLHLYQLPTRQDTILSTNIGRSLHKIPGEQAFSFVRKVSEKDWLIKKVDLSTMKTSTITTTLPGHEDIAWTPDGSLLSSDGEKIFVFRPGKDTTWREVSIKTGKEFLKGVTRLAVSQQGDKLAIVVAE
jgi:Tol biopolymer transport system component